MKRNIINIDTEKCNGCGQCIPGCPEGALQVIDGKARLVSDLFCDGLGACIKQCPVDAIQIEEREAEPYDERRVMENISKQGANTIKAHLMHLKNHGETAFMNQAVSYLKEHGIEIPSLEEPAPHHGCPGSMMRDMRGRSEKPAAAGFVPESRLEQWPIQMKLINPAAPFFDDADLLVAADCTAFSYGNFHEKFIKNHVMIMFCPKLDQDAEGYIEKLTRIFELHRIKSVTIARMEVPCCGGTTYIVEEALKRSGKNIIVREFTISINGEII